MPDDLMPMTGVLVAATARDYKAFTDRWTGETRPGGTAYAIWLVEGPEVEPIKVGVPDGATFAEIRDAKVFGEVVDVVVALGARQNRITRRLEAFRLAGK